MLEEKKSTDSEEEEPTPENIIILNSMGGMPSTLAELVGTSCVTKEDGIIKSKGILSKPEEFHISLIDVNNQVLSLLSSKGINYMTMFGLISFERKAKLFIHIHPGTSFAFKGTLSDLVGGHTKSSIPWKYVDVRKEDEDGE